MKTRKLFAILTLVAFMMTLLPVAAFAANPTYIASGSKVALKSGDDKVDVYNNDEDNLAEITLTFKDSLMNRVEGQDVVFYMTSSRDAEVGYVDDADGTQQLISAELSDQDNGQEITAKTDDDGQVKVYVGSNVVGEFTVKFYDDDPESDDADADGILIGSATVTVESGDADTITLEFDDLNKLDDDEWLDLDDYLTTDEDAADFEAGIADGTKKAVVVGNEFTLRGIVSDGGNELEDEVVYLKKSYEDGSFKTIAEATTDENGEVEFDIAEDVIGNYKYRLELESDDDVKTTTDYIKWVAEEGSTIAPKDEEGLKIAKDEDYDLEFVVKDFNGNEVKNADVTLEFKSAPEDAKYEEDDTLSATTDKDGEAKFTLDPDEEGKYVVEAYLTDDEKVKTTFEFDVKEYDEAAEIKAELKDDDGGDDLAGVKYAADLADDSSSTKYDGFLDVDLVDSNGVELDSPNYGDLLFSSSNPDILTITSDGYLKVVEDDDDKLKTVTITIVDKDSKVSTTFDVPVVGNAEAIEVTTDVDGLEAEVTMQLVDENGNKTYPDVENSSLDDLAYDIVKSGGTTKDVEKFDKFTGEASFDVEVDEAGTYSFTVVTDQGVAKSFTIDFETPAAEMPVYGAKNVTMFIGSTGFVKDGAAMTMDQAPFIQDGRTFVPVRMVGEALGAEVEYDAATQMITLTREDMTVTMTVGSNILTKSTGEAVVSDVAPFIVAQTGRTVIPFRAIAEAFGADVEPVFAADGTVTAVTFAQ